MKIEWTLHLHFLHKNCMFLCTFSCTDTRNLSLVIFCRDQLELRLDSFHEDISQPKVRYSLSFSYDNVLHISSSLSASEINRGRTASLSVYVYNYSSQENEWLRKLKRAQQSQVMCMLFYMLLDSGSRLYFFTILFCHSGISWNSSAGTGELYSCLARWRNIFWSEIRLLLFLYMCNSLYSLLTSCACTHTQMRTQ